MPTDEAEALFKLTREQAYGFALQYPRVKIEDGVSGRAGGEPEPDPGPGVVAYLDEEPQPTKHICECQCREPGGSGGETQTFKTSKSCADFADVRCKRKNGGAGFLGHCREKKQNEGLDGLGLDPADAPELSEVVDPTQ